MNISCNDISFKASAKPAQKIFSSQLRDGKDALTRITFNNDGKVCALETIISDSKNKLVDGKGIISKKPLSPEKIADFFELLQNKANNGVNFFKEFIRAMR